jgi:phosphatidylglycerol---prolipoprotein diacylglyceryl transferase
MGKRSLKRRPHATSRHAAAFAPPDFLLKPAPPTSGAAVPYPNIDPIWFSIGPLPIRWYALAYVAGILLGWRYAVYLVRRESLWPGTSPTATPVQIDDMILWITLGIILGGRLGSVLFYSPHLIWESPLEILQIWNGGMSFHGGLIGVTVALILFARQTRVSLLGQFFGRVANFINGELWGRPTDVSWGMVFCNDHIAARYGGRCPPELLVPRHPSQLYEAALEGLLLFAVLAFVIHARKWLPRRGAVTGLFLILYGLFRTVLETVREPDVGMSNFPLGLTMGMMLSIPMIALGAFLLWRAFRRAPTPAKA